MRIAQVSPLWLEVPPQNYGGTEYVISLLTEELVNRGHEVTLFATADSKTSAKLIPIWPRGLFKDKANASAVQGLLLKELLARQSEFDIIHDHTDTLLLPLSSFLKPPIVSTLHGIPQEESIILRKKFPAINYISISRNQKKSEPGTHIIATVHHGINVEDYDFNDHPQDYLLWISNIEPSKGLAYAIQIAKMADEKLVIAGSVFSRNADYFEHRIQPLIDGKQIRFMGVADFQKKVELFKNAKAFLFPIFKRPEPFGLVIIESMACGTPVIAPPVGSLPELVVPEKTGFLIDTPEDGVQAIKKIKKISRTECRKHVERNFPLKKMVDRYEAIYRKVLGISS